MLASESSFPLENLVDSILISGFYILALTHNVYNYTLC